MNLLKNKLKYLVDFSLKKKICSKWFFIANILLVLVLVAVTNIDSVIQFFGGDFDDKITVYVIDETKNGYDVFNEQFMAIDMSINGEEESSYEIIEYENDLETLKKELEEDEDIIAIQIFEDDTNVISATILSESYIDTIDYQLLVQTLERTKQLIAMQQSDVSAEELNKIYDPIVIERVILDETKKSENESMDMIMSTVFPIFILPFFMLTIFLVQMIGAEVNDEKTTRGMEIIISNVSPKIHFASKVIAGNIFVVFQGILLVAYFCLGLLVRKLLGAGSIMTSLGSEMTGIISGLMETEFISKLGYIIPLSLVLMLLTFIAYSLLAGILASMTTSAEDFGQLQTPIMLISLIGYYLAIMAGMFKGALFIRILSYVPLISAILSPSLLVLGQIGVIDVIISILITMVTNYLLIHYGMRIYKVGILNYSSKDLWKKMFKAVRQK